MESDHEDDNVPQTGDYTWEDAERDYPIGEAPSDETMQLQEQREAAIKK